MSVEFVMRLVGMVIFALLGVQSIAFFRPDNAADSVRLIIALTLAGAALGLLLAPYITTRPFNWARGRLRQIPASQLISSVVGLAVGLAISALLNPSLSALPEPYGGVMPVVISLLFGYIGAAIMVMRQHDIFNLIGMRLPSSNPFVNLGSRTNNDVVLLDTSVIIDGRIADISQTGFIRSTMLVPSFVLNELQHIADSSDPLRRNRGRRGLDLLRRLQKDSRTPVQITDLDVEGVTEVDDKLVILAKQMDCPIITNDFNLNSVAKLQGVVVLNINELANAVKTDILAGETLSIKIIQEGRERDQGIGFRNDGTMVVVKNGRHHLGESIKVTVTKVLQTTAGRMIFAELEQRNDS
jgi:uncharacterized protein YacL